MKNTFKKSDAKGNKLPEQIGKGLNYNHPLVKKSLNDKINFHINKDDKKDFMKFCEKYGGISEVLRNYVKSCIK